MKTLLTSDTLHGLCQALAHQLHAGISHGDALSLMAQDAEAPLAGILSSMAAEADSGLPLAQVFERAGCFPHALCGLLAAGEQVGRTEQTLFALARYHGQRAAAARQLRSAVLYPAMLAAVMLVVTVVLLCWVLPVFDRVYGVLGSRLTGLAGGLLLFGQGLRRALPWLGAAVAAAAVLLLIPGLRRAAARWLGRLRSRSKLSQRRQKAHLAQALALGLAGGLPHAEAFRGAAGAAGGCAAFRSCCQTAQNSLDSGASLPAVLRDNGLLPPAECRLLEAAMRSGSGDAVMEEIAQRLQERSDQAAEARLSAVEPALVLISSLLIGMVLTAVMLPLAQLMAAMG